MNAAKKRHFRAAERNLAIAKECIHRHRTTTAFVALVKAIRHLSAVILDLWPIEEAEKQIKAQKISRYVH